MNNIELSKKILEFCYQLGARDFIACAGARNSSFIELLQQQKYFQIFNFFEERSASFFALGLSKKTSRPSIVCCTSGTALAEILPACIEAFYSQNPIIVISADRPKSYRGSGAPQSIEQKNLLSDYAQVLDLDLKNWQELENFIWDSSKNLHLNICLDEPLIDSQNLALNIDTSKELHISRPRYINAYPHIQSFVQQHKDFFVLLGEQNIYAEIELTKEFLLHLKAPILCDANSPLRECPELQDLILKSGENIVAKALQNQQIKAMLRIGKVPSFRLWRDFEDKFKSIPSLHLSTSNFSGLSYVASQYTDCIGSIESYFTSPEKKDILPTQAQLDLVKQDTEQTQKLSQLLQEHKHSEPTLVQNISKHLAKKSLVYLGNSLSIREWSLCAGYENRAYNYSSNRGANGIDGQVSSFLGQCQMGQNYCIIGDLTAMYDLAGPWAYRFLAQDSLAHIIVINNSGGQIFSRMFNNPIFINEHQQNFENWAKMWNLDYHLNLSFTKLSNLTKNSIIEYQVDNKKSLEFWSEYKNL